MEQPTRLRISQPKARTTYSVGNKLKARNMMLGRTASMVVKQGIMVQLVGIPTKVVLSCWIPTFWRLGVVLPNWCCIL